MADTVVTEHVHRAGGHASFYLAAGPEDGPLVILTHGWPELSISWRHQLPVLAGLGFRAVAPDMRGYGRSTVYDRHEAYGMEQVAGDMLALLDALDRERAVWVGHDWGSPVVWAIASHSPERCHGVASLCVPYGSIELGLDGLEALVDREIYPADEFPAGQWEYMRFYEEQFDTATASMDADPVGMARLLFRKGNPDGRGKPAGTAYVRKFGGWFRGAEAPPAVPRDADVVSEEDLSAYGAALARNGFFGPNSYYMNHAANQVYAERAVNGGRLDMPVLFLSASYDYTCETVTSRLGEPMREKCADLTWVEVPSGHWMAQERPAEVNAALVHWLATKLPQAWPT